MTVTSTTNKIIYTGDNSTVIFPYTFKVFANTELVVELLEIATDITTTLVLTTNYTVSGVGVATGGNVTTVSTYANTHKIIIRRLLPLTQGINLVENDPSSAGTSEDSLDKSVMRDQQLQEQLDRAILQDTSNVSSITFPSPTANELIGWDPTGVFLVNSSLSSLAITSTAAVDAAATADYLGNSGANGILRVSGLLTHTDGGNFVTLGLTSGLVDHDATLNFSSAEHFTMLDEDTLVSDSDTQAATQQSIKAYVDAATSASLTQAITQASHPFSLGDWVYYNGSAYALADASAAATAECIGVVLSDDGTNDFTLQFGGRITGLSGLTAGEAHFLSETAGAITATAPTTEASVSKPVLIADSTTTGYVFNMRGSSVTNTELSFYTSFVDADLTTSVLTVAHNLGHKFCQVVVYDNNDKMIIPTDITLTDNNNLDVSLLGFGTISGTWNVVVLDKGATTNSASNLVQVVNTQSGAVSSTATTIPADDTIPQITEGAEFMTAAITPTNANNILYIDVMVHFQVSTEDYGVVALFQDATAGALAAGLAMHSYDAVGGGGGSFRTGIITFKHKMTAGTTSATTFRVRGGGGGGTFTFNGAAAARLLGGVISSSITVTEVAV